MNPQVLLEPWLWATFGLIVCLIPCAYLCIFKNDVVDCLIGLETAGLIETLVLLCLAQGFQRNSFFDLALAMSILTFGGGLVFVRFLARWA
jgi:multicomponent Na+:H+ antiporter subunit F